MTDPKDLDITLYMAKRCTACKEKGALATGLCLKCLAKRMLQRQKKAGT